MDITENKDTKKTINKAKKDKKVMAVALFGSSLYRKGRDIDLCLFLDKKYTNLEMSKKRLDYLKEVSDKIDIQIFQQLPIYIRIRIIKECKILLEKNSDFLYGIAFDTIKEFKLYEKLYFMYLEEVKNGPRKNLIKI